MDHSHHHHDHSGHDHAAMDSTTASSASTTGMPMDMSGHAHHNHGEGGHSMAFHGGLNQVVLFQFWETATPLSMILSCIVVVLLCFVMEATRWSRLKREEANKAKGTSNSKVTSHRLIDACLHAVQLTISYMLMLVFMTYNAWLCVATVVGEVLARLLFTCFLPVEDECAADTACH